MFDHLFVLWASPKILTFENIQINLVFYSLIRIFAAEIMRKSTKND